MKLGIFYRLLFSLIFIFLISTSFIAFNLINETESIFKNSRLHQANTMAQSLAEGSVDAIAVNDYELLEGWLRGAKAIDDFAYAYLSRSNGIIINHTDISLVALQSESIGEIKKPILKDISYQERPVNEVIHPVFLGSKHMANVHIAYFTDTISFYTNDFILKISSLLMISLIALSLLTYIILKWILKPIESLANTMKKITHKSDYSHRADKYSDDEIGLLVDSFNNMLDQMKFRDDELITEKEHALASENEAKVYAHEVSLTNNELESEISERIKIEFKLKNLSETLEQRVKERTTKLEELNKVISDVSRSAGMAEIANGIIHNVGNVLNSVNTSSSVIRDQIKNSTTSNIFKLVDMLEINKENLTYFLTHNDKGSQVLPFLKLIAEKQQSLDHDNTSELNELDKNINHIKNIITMQQSFSGDFGITENVNMTELISDAIKIISDDFLEQNISIIEDFEQINNLHIDRHKILQIIINLLSNAKNALIYSDTIDKKITIKLSKCDGNIEVIITDNGIGIAHEDMPKLFNYGFTRRKNGHGFGLHNCALLAKDINGEIKSESEGCGKGACFIFNFRVN